MDRFFFTQLIATWKKYTACVRHKRDYNTCNGCSRVAGQEDKMKEAVS